MAMVRVVTFPLPTTLERITEHFAHHPVGLRRGHNNPKTLLSVVEGAKDARCTGCSSNVPEIGLLAYGQMDCIFRAACSKPECYKKAWHEAEEESFKNQF